MHRYLCSTYQCSVNVKKQTKDNITIKKKQKRKRKQGKNNVAREITAFSIFCGVIVIYRI